MSGDRHDVGDDHRWFIFRNENSSDVDNRILFIAIITLSAVVVVVTMLHIYIRYILRRQARRRVAFQGIGLSRVHSDEPPKRGLEPTVIASLPVLMYRVDGDHGPGPECTVCLGSFENGQMMRVLPNCKHHFHAECIDKWLESQSSCPICRHEVELGPSILPLAREPSTRSGPPSAPPLERTVSLGVGTEGTSDETIQSSVKVNGSISRLRTLQRMLSMDRSSQRNNSCGQDGIADLERQ